MSEWYCTVVEIGKVERHPNADTLEITQVMGSYPVIFKEGSFKTGDKAVYIGWDSVVPDTEQFAFLKGKNRIKASKLRGIFSMGLLVPVPDLSWEPGQHVAGQMEITKYEPDDSSTTKGLSGPPPSNLHVPVYDLEGLRKYRNMLVEGEEIILTEKIHGCNAKFVYSSIDRQLFVGSHRQWKREDDSNVWWKMAKKYNLEEKLKLFPDVVFFGEIYGDKIQSLKYGCKSGEQLLAIFDVMQNGKYLNYDDMVMIVRGEINLPVVPFLYRGPWSEDLLTIAEQNTKVPGSGEQISEGFVVRPVVERWNDTCGRTVLKYPSENYLLSKDS